MLCLCGCTRIEEAFLDHGSRFGICHSIILNRCWRNQFISPMEQCIDGIRSGNHVGCGHRTCDVHGASSGGADGMRGDGVGVGDIGTVPGDAGRSGDAAGGDDSRRTIHFDVLLIQF